MESGKRDYYEVLGVARDAGDADIKKAYRKLAFELHPDRNPGDTAAEEKFKEAAEAYGVLSDGQKRAMYDRFGHQAPGGGGFGGGFRDVGDIFSAFGDIFGDLFGMGAGMGGRSAGRGADLETEVKLTLGDAFTGASRTLEVKRRVSCRTCNGSGAEAGSARERCERCGGRGQVVHAQGFLMISTTCPACRGEGSVVKRPCKTCRGSGLEVKADSVEVKVPAGVEDGATLRLPGAGEPGQRGGPPGHLYVHLQVEDDPRFERDGADLHAIASVSFPQVALGAEIEVPTIDGDPARITLKPGTQPGDVMVVAGRGMPQLHGRGHGDLHVHVRVVVPASLTGEQEAALRAFAAAGGDAVKPEGRGFFGRKRKRG